MRKKPRLQSVQIMTQRHVIKTTKSKTEIFKKEIIQYLDGNGYLSWSTKDKKYMILGTNSPKNGLVSCPECKVRRIDGDQIKDYKKKIHGLFKFLRRMQSIITSTSKSKDESNKETM